MDNQKIASYIDHTLLKAFATWEQMVALCDEAVKYKTASVCIPPNYIKRVKDKYGDKLMIATVIGFPLGYMTTEAKACETEVALKDGADEIDMVINVYESIGIIHPAFVWGKMMYWSNVCHKFLLIYLI